MVMIILMTWIQQFFAHRLERAIRGIHWLFDDDHDNDDDYEQILFRIANCHSLQNLKIEDRCCICCHTVELISINTNNDIIQ